ncbi:hypothetical protein J3Q64DRAFT_1469613 [Phycomyces blakesleeanus]|uniref:Uncharacterized protein n=2 Tax=Phycomyces blakesleeanus TaxID=4837 RepID=A0A167NHV5_PHYB8|nr:hypothetical protein PHYBLDRAFT_59463 [Phycomyces blakesleeanus NRRL 1555(-)]OAD75934.1 hypothetical protein PHYBLDRAFT_59463 [Phycomyces blakesleeanus NRRL 1555(-)]|eukprot:XP_018293974.1 hypothetical protein PHYBLDRAFT_59463 [Phycomyces blakesleeanus NRRL 1555(-)]
MVHQYTFGVMSSSNEFIVYLEPTHSSDLWKSVNEFVHSTAIQFYPTTASRYNCHASMTGFFKIDSQDASSTIRDLSIILESTVQSYFKKGALQVGKKSILVKNLDKEHPKQIKAYLLLPVTVLSLYHQGTQSFADRCKTVFGIQVRPKPINHISLAYWDEPDALPQQTEEWNRLIMEDKLLERMEKTANEMFEKVSNPDSWDIVLYERVVKGHAIGEMHKFVECRRCKVANEIVEL